jgi:hypothetical protein
MRQLLWAKRHQHYPRYPRPQNVGSGISVRHASRPIMVWLLAQSARARLRLDGPATDMMSAWGRERSSNRHAGIKPYFETT